MSVISDLVASEDEHKVRYSKAIRAVSIAAIVTFFILWGLASVFNEMGLSIWWILPTVGVIIASYFWRVLADRFSGILATPIMRLVIIGVAYGTLLWVMYDGAPTWIQDQTGVNRRIAWQIALLAGMLVIPGIWKILEPAQLFPGTGKIVGVGNALIAIALILVLEWTYWQDTDAMFDHASGESTFWVGAPNECPYGNPGFSTYDGRKLVQGTVVDANRFRTDPKYTDCAQNLLQATAGRAGKDPIASAVPSGRFGTWKIVINDSSVSKPFCPSNKGRGSYTNVERDPRIGIITEVTRPGGKDWESIEHPPGTEHLIIGAFSCMRLKTMVGSSFVRVIVSKRPI